MAVPSTTSIIMHPVILSYFSMLVNCSVMRQAMDPPREWPTITTFLSGYFCISYFRT